MAGSSGVLGSDCAGTARASESDRRQMAGNAGKTNPRQHTQRPQGSKLRKLDIWKPGRSALKPRKTKTDGGL